MSLETRDRILEAVGRLKAERRAVILAHNYQPAEVQDAADFVGDSLELSRTAAKSEAEVIVFCGVHFMAETASILSPGKTVLLPDPEAGCPMADMITADELRQWKARHPGRPVVCYVNTSAEVADIEAGRRRHPEAEVWAHPECRPEVIDLADKALSTGQMVAEARRTTRREIILATEQGIIHRLKKENPDTEFYPVRAASLCLNMKKITLAKVLLSLERNQTVVTVAPEVARRARGAIEKMIAL
jgi:quinolinate synthase